MLEFSVLCIVSAKKNSGGSKTMQTANRSVVVTVSNVTRSLRFVCPLYVVPHF
ncbi:MAG: hypothetical protein RLY69_18 [Verrucomicrobiota bacterium]